VALNKKSDKRIIIKTNEIHKTKAVI